MGVVKSHIRFIYLLMFLITIILFIEVYNTLPDFEDITKDCNETGMFEGQETFALWWEKHSCDEWMRTFGNKTYLEESWNRSKKLCS